MGFAKGSSSGGKHALGRQQPTGKPSRSTAGKGKGLFSKPAGKHAGGGKGKGGDRSGAAGGLDRWG